ncbi:hypothetical protein DL546_003147 [Coniochaeta pulveracea]|uniref:Uncharacterized protein n=1 Tax=Coniochaeta pulveracea TaxID=177199 RepID=A0A420Y796_9PEZI|nr:hypothetical protein DL546_003147 [Coniochaeta pulveracea]
MFAASPLRPIGKWLAHVALLSSLLSPTLAAYVQFQDCLDTIPAQGLSSQAHFSPESLKADLHQWHDATTVNLRISGRFPGKEICDDAPTVAFSRLRVSSIAGTAEYDGKLDDVNCDRKLHFATEQGPYFGYNISYTVKRMHPVEAFELQVHLQGDDGKAFGCLRAPLTPEIGHDVTTVARWVPICILALVVAAAGLQSLPQFSWSSATDQAGPFFREASRAHLTHIADCLSYIQFIFFSGALSLSYPGFFQPVVSHSSWSTLMTSPGPVAHSWRYHGIADGIYEVNGTFGGTHGMELMTQVIGAPVTMGTWTNVITYTAIIFVLLVAVIQVGKCLNQTRDWFAPPRSPEERAAHTFSGVSHTAWTAFRALISYFLLPVVAWTTYQLDYAQLLPFYHTTICAIVLFILVVCCWWAATQSSPRQMGYLILDSSKDYQTLMSMSRSQDVLSIAMFGLLFARGATIGGLQFAGLPQLLVLVACEIMQLALVTLVRTPAAVLSTSGLTTVARLIVTLLSVLFVPGVAALEFRSIFGYMILALHGSVLVFCFLSPALFRMARLLATASGGPGSQFSDPGPDEPQIYGLRRLRQRPTTVNNLTHPTVPHIGLMQPDTIQPGRFPSSSLDSNSPASSLSHDTNRYYFRPRSRISSAELLRSQASISPPMSENPTSDSQHDGRSSHPSSEERRSSETSFVDVSDAVRLAEAARFANVSVDYSVREVDMYYKRAGQRNDCGEQRVTESEVPSASSSTTTSARRKVSDLWKERFAKPVKVREEKGFVVIRPPRTVPPSLEVVPREEEG